MMTNRISLKESLFLGFCAVFIVVFRAGLRLHLGIPGHSMLFTLFFLMLARGCVPNRFTATWTGLMSGALAMVLGLGKGGPLILLKFILPALVIDLSALLNPRWFNSYIFCLAMAAAAASTKFFNTYLVDILIGMDKTVTLQHSLLGAMFGSFFGMAGSMFVPPVMGKLNAHGIIDTQLGSKPPPA